MPSVAVPLIQKGEVVWTLGYGFANAATAKAMTPEAVFKVGSLSNMASAWCDASVVEGKVDLDRPVDSYLKRWQREWKYDSLVDLRTPSIKSCPTYAGSARRRSKRVGLI